MKHRILHPLAIVVASLLGCHASLGLAQVTKASNLETNTTQPAIGIVVAGIAQDAGYPQAGCDRKCCQAAWKDPSCARMVSCLALVDRTTNKKWFFDCTPDFPRQLRLVDEFLRSETPSNKDQLDGNRKNPETIAEGIFLTHAHIGHYTGLMHLGREVIGSDAIPVYAMPRMEKFLRSNGPWSQLVELGNIRIRPLRLNAAIELQPKVSVTPIMVPHRDEFSETVGFLIAGPKKKALFIPDIDKWSKWNQSIDEWITKVDYALIDGTFMENGEIPGRDMSMIPHPFVTESIKRFSALDQKHRCKVKFIHLNHTNPAMAPNSHARKAIERAGMSVARQGEFIAL